jgi:hypothetical protein
MLREKQENIMGVNYVLRQMPVRQCAQWAYRVAKAIGPAIATLAKDNTAFDVALGEVFRNFSEKEALEFMEAFLCYCERDGVVVKKELIDHIYAGNGGEMISAVVASAKYNLAGFMNGLGDISGMLPGLVAKAP